MTGSLCIRHVPRPIRKLLAEPLCTPVCGICASRRVEGPKLVAAIAIPFRAPRLQTIAAATHAPWIGLPRIVVAGRSTVTWLTGGTQNDGTRGKTDDSRDSRGTNIVVVSLAMLAMRTMLLVVSALMAPPAVALVGLCGRNAREQKSSRHDEGEKWFCDFGHHGCSSRADRSLVLGAPSFDASNYDAEHLNRL